MTKYKLNKYNWIRITYSQNFRDQFAPNSLLWLAHRSGNPDLASSLQLCTKSNFRFHPRPFFCAPARLLLDPEILFRWDPNHWRDFYENRHVKDKRTIISSLNSFFFSYFQKHRHRKHTIKINSMLIVKIVKKNLMYRTLKKKTIHIFSKIHMAHRSNIFGDIIIFSYINIIFFRYLEMFSFHFHRLDMLRFNFFKSFIKELAHFCYIYSEI